MLCILLNFEYNCSFATQILAITARLRLRISQRLAPWYGFLQPETMSIVRNDLYDSDIRLEMSAFQERDTRHITLE
jgi:hypothetical protein